jgi:hypothetical protein
MHDLHLVGLNGTSPTTHVSPIFFNGSFNQTGSIQIYNNTLNTYGGSFYWVSIEYTK